MDLFARRSGASPKVQQVIETLAQVWDVTTQEVVDTLQRNRIPLDRMDWVDGDQALVMTDGTALDLHELRPKRRWWRR
jgi:hypothetical protein